MTEAIPWPETGYRRGFVDNFSGVRIKQEPSRMVFKHYSHQLIVLRRKHSPIDPDQPLLVIWYSMLIHYQASSPVGSLLLIHYFSRWTTSA